MNNTSEIKDIVSKTKKFLNSTFWLTPLNLASEEKKFLDSKISNPTFKYPDIPASEVSKNLKKLYALKTESNHNDIKNFILDTKLKELQLKLKLLLARGTSSITVITSDLYDCRFDEMTKSLADRDSKLKVEFAAREILTVHQTLKRIRESLDGYKLKNWKIEKTNLTDFYFRVNSGQKKIYLGNVINWDFTDLDNMLAHEIDGHVLRAVNAERQKEEMFQKPLPFYLKTEEGLASFLGDYCSTSSEISRKHHAIKYLAGIVARKTSFREVFNFFTDHGFTYELAFRRTFRLKRGFADTTIPGVFAREAVYYSKFKTKCCFHFGLNIDI